jgi:ring-1,2-phenylacetyl-CoA epoxidase subunit PaaD
VVTGRAGLAEMRAVVGQVPDPEIPVLTLADLGILRDVRVAPDGRLEVDITPTYSGCPAMDTISADIAAACARHGWPGATVRQVLAPAWSTDWMSAAGQRKLAEFGIAPPARRAGDGPGPIPVPLSVRCPRCGSLDTRETSRFGSTACKALYACRSCLEPFDYFKAL